MRTSDEIGKTTTNKTSNTEHLLHGDHQIFKYFTGPPNLQSYTAWKATARKGKKATKEEGTIRNGSVKWKP